MNILYPVSLAVALGSGICGYALYDNLASNSMFKANPVALNATLAWCDDHTGAAIDNADCKTASDVRDDNSFREFHDKAAKLKWPGAN